MIYLLHNYSGGERNMASLKSFLSQYDQTQLSILLLKPLMLLLYYPSYLHGLPQVLLQYVSIHVVLEMLKLNVALQTQFYKCKMKSKMKNKQTKWIASLYFLAEILLVSSQICLIFTLRVCFWLVVLQVFSENHLSSHLNSAVQLPVYKQWI